ncbi:CHRD domain-containing protein [Embleya sp. NBC_00896]|uniref:CHRD domain-containing protein n=1 Tax=Embleya sp. NBC_00896 TaxID=2975961 RepID=UPI003865FFB1|nr:CHRD domain-containing protein [Embleya sp. NBC_00896]
MSARRFTLPTLALATTLAFAVTGCSSSDDKSDKSGAANTETVNVGQGSNDPGATGAGAEHGGEHGAAVPASNQTTTGAVEPANGEETFFAAGLSGANEVPGGGAAVGDKDGKGTALVRIKGDQVSFGIRWEGIGAPTAAHLHLGGKGKNGEVKVPFFASPLPDSAQAVTGSVKVTDAALLDKIKADPASLYFNVHTGEFPGGAVRGQLVKLAAPADVKSVLKNGTLPAEADAKQEVPNAEGKKTGDPDGRASTSVRPWGNCIDWSFSWTGIAPPTLGHLHKAPAGANGDVVAPLFDAKAGLPQSVTGLAGTVEGIDPALVERINATPANYYTNLHTGEFPGGAVRGQLAQKVTPKPPALNYSVLTGKQIYQCTTKDGVTAFTQFDVAAKLQGDIKHSFVNPSAGPPQWIAPDGSSVTGAVATKLPNGDANIPELVLNATQTGKTGLFSATTQILRLNTQGGVAPAGTCDPATRPTAEVPYQADYLFIG